MTNQPLVDAHLHLWDPGKLRYRWLEDHPPLNRPYLLNDYDQATAGLKVERMVFVQCDCEATQARAEVEWVLSLAKADRRIAGIVAFAPLEQGDAAETELTWLTRHRLVKGCRRILQGESDAQFCLQPSFVQGVRQLQKFDLSFDLCIRHDQLGPVTELVRLCPGVRFMLDHIGKPNIAQRDSAAWKRDLRLLAALPNVWCKLSGVVTEADPQTVTRDDLVPYVDHVIECFGFDRIVFGCDWPVVNLAGGLRRWIGWLGEMAERSPPAQRHQLYYANAVSFYRLGAGD